MARTLGRRAPIARSGRWWLRRALHLAGLAGLGILCLIVIAVFVLPYVWMVASSLRPQSEIFRFVYPVQWRTFVPTQPTLENFQEIFSQLAFGRSMLNSLGVALAVVIIGAFVNSLAGFAFARMPLPGRQLLLLSVLSIVFIPFEAIVIPMYLVVRAVGIDNSYLALILPWIVNPFGVFIMREFFLQIPQDLEDAAKVDGASWFWIYWHVMLPHVRPGLVTVALLQFLGTWDAFFWPLVAVQDPNLTVVQVAIASFSSEAATRWDLIFAGATAATIPILAVFVLLQRYYVRGIVRTGMK